MRKLASLSHISHVRNVCLFVVVGMIFSLMSSSLVGASAFNPSNLIDDSVFDNTTSMNAAQIDSWLNANFPSSCISTNRGFQARVPSGYSPSGGFTYGPNGSAGQVITTAANVYGLNPQVILVTLQKEQSLVSGGAGCSVRAYSAATGYGCPDSGGAYSYSGVDLYTINGTTVTSVPSTCVNSSAKVGFSQQVIRTAWLLKFSQQRSLGNTGWAVITGSWDNSDDLRSCYSGAMTQGYRKRCPNDANAVFYDGYTTIDGMNIHIDTGATAGLYRYTPHFSGNQNFFNLFTAWFGSVYGGTIGPTAYRMYSPQNNDHYFTARENDRFYAKLRGYRDDQLAAFKVSATQDNGMIPIYTLYNGRLKDYILLPDGMNYYWAVVHGGYASQGVAFYAYPASAAGNPVCPNDAWPVYQAWHGGFTEHFYSISGLERYWALIAGGYIDDGSSAFKDPNGGVSFCVPQ